MRAFEARYTAASNSLNDLVMRKDYEITSILATSLLQRTQCLETIVNAYTPLNDTLIGVDDYVEKEIKVCGGGWVRVGGLVCMFVCVLVYVFVYFSESSMRRYTFYIYRSHSFYSCYSRSHSAF